MLTCSKCGKFIAHPDAVHTCESMTLPTPTPLTDAEMNAWLYDRSTFGPEYEQLLARKILATITSLQSDLQRTREALEALVGAPLTYNAACIEIECKSHQDAMERVRKARSILTPPTGT